ncbi:LamG-like jellyroll fold domain-containing protein [Luteolibacter soli]|uniref:LamG-like jellyroll fold domain-containing protein n=1 Tax=Luteolibacter soli TaxID=3135280 RepID=A0ABU9AUJ7_9BACT
MKTRMTFRSLPFAGTRHLAFAAVLLSSTALTHAHPLSFNSTISYSSTQPTSAPASISQWTGATFDAANIGGSGVNSDGGTNNGTANDATTYVANNQPRQGQLILTGNNANGYDATSFTVRMAGYTNNTASGNNRTSWDLNFTNGPIIVEIGKLNGTAFSTVSAQCFTSGGTGHPGAGTSTNGSGTYVTFNLPFSVHLEPNTTYGFDLRIGNGSSAYFEWLGTNANPYSGGAAYTRNGATITPLTGDRVFQVNMTATSAPYTPFSHPGTLHSAADLARMASKVAANAQPWKADFDQLAASPYAQTGWGAYNVDYINRGGTGANNYTRSQQDAQAIYELALRWHITGNTAYADRAVQIANVWSDLIGVTGDTNASLAAGICGYLFATGGELLSTYPGWPAAEKQAYKDMMMRVFYPANFDFLWRHHGTPESKGGNTHYRLNWDTCNMASMAAIGVLCDNRAVYQQAVDYFKYGPGNGRVERAAWMLHPEGLAQGEEAGRDQGHNQGGWYCMALLCQTAWNQGDDLFAYDNNRVLRAFEYVAKYNLGNSVPYTEHRNASLTYTEGAVAGAPGLGYIVGELVYNHYANIKGIAAPYCKLAADTTRPEGYPHVEYHPSAVDWIGLGTLTQTRDPIAAGATPSGLTGYWSKNRVTLNWFGSTYATSYNLKRSTTPGGPYTTIATTPDALNLTATDTTVSNSNAWFYVVSANTPSGETANSPELRVARDLVTRYTFDNTISDAIGTRHATAMGGATAPGYATGFSGQAISLNGTDQYVQLPAGSGNYRDITIASWVYWNGGNAWQRVFDFGSEIEKYMMLTVNAGSNLLRFQMTTSRGTDGTLTITGPAMPVATWTHVAITLNGDTATLYVNGVPVGTATGPLDPLFGQPFCYLGKSIWNGDPYFSGRIDDFRIYNHALSGNDVYSLWGQSANTAPAFTLDPITKPDATEDSAYTGQTLANDATDANGGTLTWSKVSGPTWLNVASNGSLTGTPPNGDVGPNLFVVRVTDPSGATDDANLYLTVNNTNDAPTWSFNPLTKPAVTQGVAYTSTLAGSASDVDTGSSIAYSKISGPSWLAVATNGALSGTPALSDVGINSFIIRATDNTGATTDATLNITVFGNSLIARYTLDGSGADSQGGPPATITGTANYTPGVITQALTFDGTSNNADLGPLSQYLYKDITVAAWVWWDGGAAHQRIFDFGSGTDEYLFLTPSNGSNMRFAIKENGVEQALDTSPLPTGTWAHIAITLGGNTATLYVNGVAKATSSTITNDPSNINLALNYLGESQFAADPLFTGRIDDFRLYNYALTPSEVAALLNGVAPIVPTGLDAGPLGNKVTLTWNTSATAQTYKVKRATTSGGPYTTIATGLTATTLVDTAVVSGTTYYYIVTAVNTQGESAPSTEATAVISDLLLRLKFDESTGTTAADSSGNGTNATLINTPAWAAGNFGNAINLPATASQHLTLPSGIVNGLTDHTISCWVKIGAFTTFSRIFDFGTGTNNYMFLTPQYTGTSPNTAKLRFAIRTPSVGEQIINSSTALTVGTWAHVAVTRSGNTGTLYVNGVQVGQNTGMTLSPTSLGITTQNYLGKSQFAADPYLNGALDEFRIYSRALSAAEIAAAANPQPVIPTGLTAGAGDTQIPLTWTTADFASTYQVKRSTTSGGPYTVIASGLTTTSFTDTGLTNGTTCYYVVGSTNAFGTSANSTEVAATPSYLRLHLKLDESEGLTASDASGLGWHGTTVNAPAWQAGKLSNSLSFTGSSSQYLTLPTGTISGLTNATFMTWVRLNGAPTTWQRIFDFGTGTTNYMFLSTQYGTGGSSNKLRFAIRTPSVAEQIINSNIVTPLGEWAHVAVVLSGTTGRLYLNGAQVGENTTMTLSPVSLGTTTQNYLGKSQWNDPYLNAALDDFRIYSRAMTTEEIATFASPLAAPSGLEATGEFQQVQLSWEAVPYASSYTVKSATTAGGPYTIVGSGLSQPAFLHTALPTGVTRYYIVSATNFTGTGADSTEASATPESAPITDGEIRNASLTTPHPGGNLSMSVASSVPGHVYQIQYSPDLTEGSWQNIGSPQTGNGSTLQLVAPVQTGSRGFYHILVTR